MVSPRIRTPWRWRALIALGQAVLLGLAACGGGGGGTSQDGSIGGGTSVGQPPGRVFEPAQTYYRVTPVGPEGVSTGTIMNAAGHIAGYYANPQGQGGFFFDSATGVSVLFDTASGEAPAVEDMNEAGQIVGYVNYEGGAQEAFSWTREGGYVRIAPLSATVLSSKALGVNEAGQVVGTLQTPDGDRAFLWSAQSGLRTELAPGVRLLGATHINDAGRIVAVGLFDGQERPVFVDASSGATSFIAPSHANGEPLFVSVGYLNQSGAVAGALSGSAFFSEGRSDSEPIDVGRLIGQDMGTYAQHLNNRGQMLISPQSLERAWYWSLQDGLIEIRPRNLYFVMFRWINEDGVAVGVADLENAQRDDDLYAVAWSRVSGAVDLNTRLVDAPAGLHLRSARMINERGQILATSGGWDTECACPTGSGTVLLTPVE